MQSAPNARDEVKVADVVVSTNHVTFLTNKFLRLISLPTYAIFVSGTSGMTAILNYRNVNPINEITYKLCANKTISVEYTKVLICMQNRIIVIT